MRLSPARVHLMASTIVQRLLEQHRLDLVGPSEQLLQRVERAMIEELSVEDRLNAEVRDILKQFEKEFEQGRADYQKMFAMVKNKLVRERGLVL